MKIVKDPILEIHLFYFTLKVSLRLRPSDV